MRIPPRIAARLVTVLVLCASALAQQKTSDAERDLLNAVNRERKAHGLSSLNSDEALANAARKHAQRMAEKETVSHQLPGEPGLPSRVKAAGAHFSWLSENVDEGPSPPAIHQSFMKSPLHRANILDSDMDSAGIGVAERKGHMFGWKIFPRRNSSTVPLPLPACLLWWVRECGTAAHISRTARYGAPFVPVMPD